MIKLNILKKVKIKEITVVASLPDMGRVGGIVSSFLAQQPKCEQIAEILSSEKPWVTHSGGLVKCAVDTYKIYYNKDLELLVFTGESQPQDPGELYELCSTFLDFVQSTGDVRRIYGAGGYLREQVTGAPRVCGVANKIELKKVLAKAGIELVGNEIATITWFNGLILGMAADRGLDAIGLFGEISEASVPQPLAAKSILSAMARMEKFEIDTKPLDRQFESILEDAQKQKKQTTGFGPGIG